MKIQVFIVLDSRSIRYYKESIVTKEIVTDRSPDEYLAELYKVLCNNDSKFIFIGDAIFNKDYIVNINAYPKYVVGYNGAIPVHK